MIRRTFMAVLGLAPVASVNTIVKATVPIEQIAPIVNPVPYPKDMIEETYRSETPLERAKMHLKRLKYEQEHGIDNFNEPSYYSVIETHTDSMKSWSKNYKARVTGENVIKLRKDLELARAEFDVKRQMKLALLPEPLRNMFW